MKKTLLALIAFVIVATQAQAQKTKVIINTEYGKIVMMLYDNTPQHRDNFIKLVKTHFYDSTLFHRVIPAFMIQGGDPDSKHAQAGQSLGNGDVGYTIPAEINGVNYHKRGVLAAARDNNPAKASSGCQFYIVVGKKFTDDDLDKMSKNNGRTYTPAQRQTYKTVGGTPHLDGNYTVFGEVLEGMDIVDKIVSEPRDAQDRPNKDTRMITVRLKKKKFLGIF